MTFKKTKNIDTAFRHVRGFTMLLISLGAIVLGFTIYKSFSAVLALQERIYILADGKVLAANASLREDNILVEARDHVATFHQLFFTLDPDDKAIAENISRALYLADRSAHQAYDNLKEKGFYSGLIAGNVNQTLHIDSVVVNTEEYPFSFQCFASQQIVRPTSITTRSLTTAGALRTVSRSDNNPHGFLIERWTTLENRDLKTELRR
ncbi:conjugative transposon protein TraK [Sphingobacterium corticis]|uniref:Conjugative transposon protein TraK n=1 Tax=Sphingobacterium corticis TaxID=1812823 RepID=A0ABW5NML8_9SPHI